MFILPHSIVTVSVITALMPRMSRAAHDGDLAAVRHDLARGMRLIAVGDGAGDGAAGAARATDRPAAARLRQHLRPGRAAGRHGAAVLRRRRARLLALLRAAARLLRARGHRTPALVNIFLNVVNIVVGYALYRALPPEKAVAGLAAGYAVAYIATTVVFWVILRPRVGGLDTYLTVRTFVRLGLAGVVSGALGLLVVRLLGGVTGSGKVGALAGRRGDQPGRRGQLRRRRETAARDRDAGGPDDRHRPDAPAVPPRLTSRTGPETPTWRYGGRLCWEP